MNKKTVQIHDGIVGALITAATVLGFKSSEIWFLIPGLIGVFMVVSAFTGFCPVYYLMGLCGIKQS